MQFDSLANEKSLQKTTNSLQEKGYEVVVLDKSDEVLEEIKKTIPEDASIMNGASQTLQQTGFVDFLKSGNHKWSNLHEQINNEKDPEKQAELRRQAVLSDYYLGSVHALTEDGEYIVASNTGSQLPHIIFTSQNLILVVSTKKIVADEKEAMRRLEEYVVPMEDDRMMEEFNMNTSLNKIILVRGENPMMGRKIKFILVKEELGF